VQQVELQGLAANGVIHPDGDGDQAALQIAFPDGFHVGFASTVSYQLSAFSLCF
jgi:hypothetical protein